MTSIVAPVPTASPRVASSRPDQGVNWHIVQLKPGGAALAERNLGRQGFEVLFPRHEVKRRSGERLVARSEALFPGYGFVAVGSNASWRTINSTYGVTRLLMSSDRTPARLPHGFIEALQSRGEQGTPMAPPELLPGDQVRITSGPFSELLARIERLEPMGRVTVLLDLLSQTVRLSLAADGLRRTGTPEA